MSDLTMSEDHLDQLARNAERALAQGATSVQTVYAADLAALTAEVRRLRAAIASLDDVHPYEVDPDPEIEAGVVHWCDTCDTAAPCDTWRALHPEEAGRRLARAALAAMPQPVEPVGWATLYSDGDLAWTTDATDAGRAWASDGVTPGTATVVALVPVEVPDATD